MENLVEIFANTLDAILGIVFLSMILGKKKSMPNWLFVVLALIVPVANVVLQKVFPDSPENNIVYILLTIFFGFVWGVRKMSFFPLFYQLFELWYTNQYTNSFSLHQLYKVQSLCYYYTTDAKKAP